jgi:hypothetical protein
MESGNAEEPPISAGVFASLQGRSKIQMRMAVTISTMLLMKEGLKVPYQI